MRIEVLYTPGCPNYQPAVERILTGNRTHAERSLFGTVEGDVTFHADDGL